MLSSVEDGPCDAAGVLSLQEQGLGFAILESEDFAVAADVEFTLQKGTVSITSLLHLDPPSQIKEPADPPLSSFPSAPGLRIAIPTANTLGSQAYLSRVDSLARECIVVGSHFEYCCRRDSEG